jgi:hypothetical protein
MNEVTKIQLREFIGISQGIAVFIITFCTIQFIAWTSTVQGIFDFKDPPAFTFTIKFSILVGIILGHRQSVRWAKKEVERYRDHPTFRKEAFRPDPWFYVGVAMASLWIVTSTISDYRKQPFTIEYHAERLLNQSEN